MRGLNYSAACQLAAERQGLVPVMEALDGAGIAYDLLQTGGFCMVVEVRRDNAGRERLWATNEQGNILVASYLDDEDGNEVPQSDVYEGTVIGAMVQAIRARVKQQEAS